MPGVFLSHSSRDKEFVTKLAIDLVNRGYPIWFDSWEMETGDSLLDRIYQGIDESTFLIIVLSQNALDSRWVQKELSGALSKEDKLNRRFVLPIKISECEIPLSIADRIYADFTGSYLVALEKLIATFKKASLHTVTIRPEQQLIPLVFQKGIYLSGGAIQRRLEPLLPSLPDNFRFNEAQFVIAPDDKYKVLRDRLIHRLEHITEDSYYSPEFEESLSEMYATILNKEEKLIEGIQLIINELAVARRSRISFSAACHWFARLFRTDILGALWMCQVPGFPDIIDYGKECASLEILTNHGAARFFEVDSVTRCDVGPLYDGDSWMSTGFSAWINTNCGAVRYLKENLFPSRILNFDDGELFEKYVVPQMVRQFLYDRSLLITWDFDNYQIGLN